MWGRWGGGRLGFAKTINAPPPPHPRVTKPWPGPDLKCSQMQRR